METTKSGTSVEVRTRMVYRQAPKDPGLLFSQPNDALTLDPVAFEGGLGHDEFTVGCTAIKSLEATFSDKQAGNGL